MRAQGKPDKDREALIEEHLRLFRDLLEGGLPEDCFDNATLDQIEERVSLLKEEMGLDLKERLAKKQGSKGRSTE